MARSGLSLYELVVFSARLPAPAAAQEESRPHSGARLADALLKEPSAESPIPSRPSTSDYRLDKRDKVPRIPVRASRNNSPASRKLASSTRRGPRRAERPAQPL